MLRQLVNRSRTAAIGAAVLVLIGQLVQSQERRADRQPISIGVWLYKFPGETEYLADLKSDFERAAGRRVELFTHRWTEYAYRTDQWMGDQLRYAPDMLVVHDYDLPIAAGRAASLEGRFSSALNRAIPGAFWAQARLQGLQLGVPWLVAPRALYYRSDLFAEAGISPPTTPEALARAAKALADPPNVYGLGVPGPSGGGGSDAFLAIHRALGGLLFNDRGRLALDDEKGEETLRWLSDLVSAGGSQPEVLSWSDVELAELLLQGRLAMLIERPWLLRELATRPSAPELGVVPVPALDSGFQHMSADIMIILETARDVDGCVEFIEFALGRDRQRALASLGVPSVRPDAWKHLPDDERWRAFADAMPLAHGASPATWAEIAPLIDSLLAVTLSGRATPRVALDSIDVQILDDPDVESFARSDG